MTQTLESSPTTEQAIHFNDLPKWIAREYGIPKPHIATMHRWRLGATRGVTLPTFLIGGRRYVRPADVRAFIRVLNEN